LPEYRDTLILPDGYGIEYDDTGAIATLLIACGEPDSDGDRPQVYRIMLPPELRKDIGQQLVLSPQERQGRALADVGLATRIASVEAATTGLPINRMTPEQEDALGEERDEPDETEAEALDYADDGPEPGDER
jgi:hypothetical protein